MYNQIKRLAEQAIALQNKNAMESALREISGMCGERIEKFSAQLKARALSIADEIKTDAEAALAAAEETLAEVTAANHALAAAQPGDTVLTSDSGNMNISAQVEIGGAA